MTVMDKSFYVDILLQEAVKLAQNSPYFSASVSFYEHNLGVLIESKYHEHLLRKNNDLDKLTRTYDRYLDFVMTHRQLGPPTVSHREEWLNIMRDMQLFKVNRNSFRIWFF